MRQLYTRNRRDMPPTTEMDEVVDGKLTGKIVVDTTIENGEILYHYKDENYMKSYDMAMVMPKNENELDLLSLEEQSPILTNEETAFFANQIKELVKEEIQEVQHHIDESDDVEHIKNNHPQTLEECLFGYDKDDVKLRLKNHPISETKSDLIEISDGVWISQSVIGRLMGFVDPQPKTVEQIIVGDKSYRVEFDWQYGHEVIYGFHKFSDANAYLELMQKEYSFAKITNFKVFELNIIEKEITE